MTDFLKMHKITFHENPSSASQVVPSWRTQIWECT